jgi:hypothetical protein
MGYEFDFGDSWEHTIRLERLIKANAFKATYLEGCGERPPEDVGGSWGYYGINMEILSKAVVSLNAVEFYVKYGYNNNSKERSCYRCQT